MISDKIKEDNYKLFALLSNYLNNAPDYITKKEMDQIIRLGVSKLELVIMKSLTMHYGLTLIPLYM